MKILQRNFKLIMSKDDDIKTAFYQLYNDDYGYIDSIASDKYRKQVREFRDNMAVDLYNLILEIEKYPINERIKHRDKLTVFTQKYFLWSNHNEFMEVDGHKIDMSTFELMTFLSDDSFLGKFKEITDKVLNNFELSDQELQTINNWLFGYYEYRKNNEGRYVFNKVYTTFLNFGMIRAMYEWIIDVASGNTEVKRCRAYNCEKLFIPAVRGIEQQYCSKLCKLREFRRKRKNIET